MSGEENARRLAEVAPGWPEALVRDVAARSVPVRAPDGARLFGPGDDCRSFVVPLRGAVRVEHVSASGRSVVLYRVGPGESCVMTTSCLLSGRPYPAWGHAEGELEALGMPAAAFLALVEERAEFRRLALAAFSDRILALVEVIDELLLRRVDLRLAQWLAARAPAVRATHAAIAAELGTAREVVSRLLGDFERRGWVALARGEVAVRDPAALETYAGAG